MTLKAETGGLSQRASEKSAKHSSGKDYLLLTLGSILIAIGVYFFKFPNHFAFGGITGFSTLALGSIVTFVAIVAAATATLKFQYWRLMREA